MPLQKYQHFESMTNKADTILAFLLGSVLLICPFSGCSSGSTEERSPESSLESAQWRSITNDGNVLMGIEFDNSTAELTVINQSDNSVGSPSLTTYDLSTGDGRELNSVTAAAIATEASYQGSFTFPGSEGPEDTALITASLGGEQAAVFVTSGEYAEFSPSFINPTLSSYVSPNPGEWGFEMQIGTDYLSGPNCPTSPSGSVTTSGDTTLYVSNNGYAAMWIADDSVVTFSRSSTIQDFVSSSYSFPVESEDAVVYGTNKWTLTPLSQVSITGVLNWDNSLGCTAAYPITMNFQNLADPSIFALCEGNWTVSYNPIVCGATVIEPGFLPSLPSGSGTLDLTYALDIPLSLSFSTFSGYQSLPNLGGTNIYGSGVPNIVLGSTLDALGNPLVIVGGIQMVAMSTTTIQGVLTVLGYGATPCTGTSTFNMSAVTGC